MCKLEYHQGSFSAVLGVCLVCFVYFLLVQPSVAEPISPATASQKASQNFTVSTNDGLVSVQATEASLKDVIEQIGRALGIEVVAPIGDEEKVKTEFQNLMLDQALRRLAPNYVIITGKDTQTITKIVILPKDGVISSVATDRKIAGTAASQGEPINDSRGPRRADSFKFEFDPSQYMKE